MTDGVNNAGSRFSIQIHNDHTESKTDSVQDRREKVLNALDEAFPFFDSSDFKTSAKKGKAENPPTGGSQGRSAGQAVKDFFSSVGKAIVSGFKAIGNFFASLGTRPTQPNVQTGGPTNVGGNVEMKDTEGTEGGSKTSRKPQEKAFSLGKAGGEFAKALSEGGLPGVIAKMEHAMRTLDRMVEGKENTLSREQHVEKLFHLDGEMGYALLPDDDLELKEMIPALRDIFNDQPAALLILDKLEAYNFHDEMESAWTSIVDDLTSGSNPIGRFMRGNNFVSAALKAYSREVTDETKLGNDLLAGVKDHFDGMSVNWAKLEPHERKKEVLTGDVATKMMEGVSMLVDELVRTEGPGNIKDRFGEEQLTRIQNLANEIALRDDIPPDVRNAAIEKLYIDQVFLRGGVTAMTVNIEDKGSPQYQATQLALSVINEANGGKFGEEMRNAYTPVMEGFREKFLTAMEFIGMPRVEV